MGHTLTSIRTFTMTEEEAIFDLSLKKKKKKKKTPFDFDAAIADGAAASEPSTGDLKKKSFPVEDSEVTVAEIEKQDGEDGGEDNEDIDLDFSKGMKKKKKKKITGVVLEEEKEEKDVVEDAEDIDLDFSRSMKKKKKKKTAGVIGDEDKDEVDQENSGVAWANEGDYTYDELLTRVFNIMREKNPEMVAGEKKKFTMRPPQVVRIGTKKTSFANFSEICKMLHRQPKHLLAFLLAELGTSGSVDGNNQLIIKGRFQQKQMENVLRRYVKEYVTCHTCRSPDTILQKDTRLFFLQCEVCGSRCSVASIKSGFQAVTGKRAAIRAKIA